MFITNYLGLPAGHAGIAFVDVRTDDDTRLFIDPCMIMLGDDRLSHMAMTRIIDYENTLFSEMRNGNWNATLIFDESHEIHDTRLGYGNGRNGKGKTANGMRESLNGLYLLANVIPEISKLQDIPVFVKDFAEDCMSDLLTNILRRELCRFTASQMAAYGVKPSGHHKIKYWNCNSHRWTSDMQPYWLIDGVRILLVPKHWVRSRFLFCVNQYLCGVIVERMRQQPDYDKLSKNDILRIIERKSKHWAYDYAKEFTKSIPGALFEYHNFMLQRYKEKRNLTSDADLDDIVYGYNEVKIA